MTFPKQRSDFFSDNHQKTFASLEMSQIFRQFLANTKEVFKFSDLFGHYVFGRY